MATGRSGIRRLSLLVAPSAVVFASSMIADLLRAWHWVVRGKYEGYEAEDTLAWQGEGEGAMMKKGSAWTCRATRCPFLLMLLGSVKEI